MDFQPSERCSEFKERLTAFMDEHVYPAEAVYERQLRESGNPHHQPAIMEELKARAREAGLWNMFLPDAEHRGGAVQQRLRAARGDPRALAHRLGGLQLLGARHRQHGGAPPVRHARAEGPLADAAARGRDPLGVRDDRARRRQLRRDQHRAAHRARRRRLRAQRAQVVDLERAAPPLPDHDRDGQDPARRARPQAAEHDPRAARHARRDASCATCRCSATTTRRATPKSTSTTCASRPRT